MRYFSIKINTEQGDYSVVVPESEAMELLGTLMLDGSENKYELEEVFFNESAVNLS